MVPFEEINIHTTVYQSCEPPQNPGMPSWYHILVLIPEIKNIPQKVESPGIFRKGIQKAQKPLFHL
jgi:hypothetical protein